MAGPRSSAPGRRAQEPATIAPRKSFREIAANTGLSLTLAACSGATTNDVLDSQLAALPDPADFVTVSVGGNDLGFSSVLTACGLPGWLGNCDAAIGAAGRLCLDDH